VRTTVIAAASPVRSASLLPKLPKPGRRLDRGHTSGGIRFADYVETNNRWTQISGGGETIQTLDARSDYAAFYFVTPWNHDRAGFTFMPVVYNDPSALVNIAGYPSDVPGVPGNQPRHDVCVRHRDLALTQSSARLPGPRVPR